MRREKGFSKCVALLGIKHVIEALLFGLQGGMDDSALSRRKNDSTWLIYHGDVGLPPATIVSQEVRALIAFSGDKPH